MKTTRYAGVIAIVALLLAAAVQPQSVVRRPMLTGPSGPPIFDAVAIGGNTAPSVSWSHTVASQSNRILLVFVYYWNFGSDTITSVTYNGVGLTHLASRLNGGGAGRTLEFWYLLNPDTGAHTTIATRSSGGFADMQGVTISLYNADQVAPSASTNFGSTNSPQPSVTLTGTSTDLFIDALGKNNGGTATVGANQTQRANFNQGGGQDLAASTAPGVASEAMDWTLSSSVNWAAIGVKVGGK